MKIRFHYMEKANRDISLSLPRNQQGSETFQIKADFFFDNLLPEGRARKFIRSFYGINGNSAFDILQSIGREVAGALVFSPENVLPEENNFYRNVTLDIRNYLKKRKKTDCIQQAVSSRISLAGMQDKLAILYKDGEMFVPIDYSPTTHIIKPDIPGLQGTVRNEHLCLSVAERLGFPVCGHSLLSMEGQDILLLERYDRVVKNGICERLHQEDFCQAMGIPAYYKYQSYGYDLYNEQGIVALSNTAKQANIDISEDLAKRCTVFYFLCNFDAHAKNYSLLYSETGCALAPIYDILCIPADGPFDRILAMEIGGIYDADAIDSNAFFLMGFDLNCHGLEQYAKDLADVIPDLVRDIAHEHIALYGNDPVYEKILNECSKISDNFKRLSFMPANADQETDEKYFQMCMENPLNLEKVPPEKQTEKLLRAICENCQYTQGVSPASLAQYVRNDLQWIVAEYHGYWGVNPFSGSYQWYDK